MPISSGLSIQDISKSFPGVQALQNITFDVPAGTVKKLTKTGYQKLRN